MNFKTPFKQRGVALFVGMIVLLVMTLIGLSAVRTTLLEERMSGSTTDSNIAFQSAEAALRAGEQSLQVPILPEFNNSNGLFKAIEFTNPQCNARWKQWQSATGTAPCNAAAASCNSSSDIEKCNWEDNSRSIAYTGMAGAPSPLSNATARYYIDEFPLVPGPGESLCADCPVDEIGFFRIVARGVGITGTTTAIVQATFKR